MGWPDEATAVAWLAAWAVHPSPSQAKVVIDGNTNDISLLQTEWLTLSLTFQAWMVEKRKRVSQQWPAATTATTGAMTHSIDRHSSIKDNGFD